MKGHMTTMTMTGSAKAVSGDEVTTAGPPCAFVAPRHRDDPDWPWLTRIGPMRTLPFRRIFIDNTFRPIPKLTALHQRWQYLQAVWALAPVQLAFLFSDGVGAALTGPLARYLAPARRIYVGFTQDGPWPRRRIERFTTLLGRCDAVTMFTEEERAIYLDRYRLEANRVRVIPIHTDETNDYRQYPDVPPRDRPFALSLGSPNRRFTPIARVCRDLGIDLVIITRPWHENDSLHELADLGAEIITDADKLRALTYLKHARLAVAAFDDPHIAGGFTTLVHAMFLRTPFVLTQCLGMAEHVIDGETGFVTPHDDEPALHEAIRRLWNDPGLAERFGEAAHRRGQARHSLTAAADMFYRLTLDVLRGP
jgi:glycosyltransferase involved in cell wall biosynthesis